MDASPVLITAVVADGLSLRDRATEVGQLPFG